MLPYRPASSAIDDTGSATRAHRRGAQRNTRRATTAPTTSQPASTANGSGAAAQAPAVSTACPVHVSPTSPSRLSSITGVSGRKRKTSATGSGKPDSGTSSPENNVAARTRGRVVNCAASTVRVKDVLTAASTTIRAPPPNRARSGRTTSTGADHFPSTTTPTATRTTWTTVTSSVGTAVPSRTSASVSSPVRIRWSTSSSRRATNVVTRL